MRKTMAESKSKIHNLSSTGECRNHWLIQKITVQAHQKEKLALEGHDEIYLLHGVRSVSVI